MKLVTGTYSVLKKSESCAFFFSTASRLSAIALLFTAIRVLSPLKSWAALFAAIALLFLAGSSPAIFASVGRPENSFFWFLSKAFSSNSLPCSLAFFLASSLASSAALSFADSMANFLALISSSVILTLRLKPTL